MQTSTVGDCDLDLWHRNVGKHDGFVTRVHTEACQWKKGAAGATHAKRAEQCGFLGWIIVDLICVYRERSKHPGPAGLGVMILP
jgi:hypothetical protein